MKRRENRITGVIFLYLMAIGVAATPQNPTAAPPEPNLASEVFQAGYNLAGPDFSCKRLKPDDRSQGTAHVESWTLKGRAQGPHAGAFSLTPKTFSPGSANGTFVSDFTITSSSGNVKGHQEGFSPEYWFCEETGSDEKPVRNFTVVFTTKYTAFVSPSGKCLGGTARLDMHFAVGVVYDWLFHERILDSKVVSPKDCAQAR